MARSRPALLAVAFLTLPALSADAAPGRGESNSRRSGDASRGESDRGTSRRPRKQGKKRGVPVVRPKTGKKRGRSNSAPGAHASLALRQMLNPEALSALAGMQPAKHVELTPGRLVDGNAFFIVSGYIVPKAVPTHDVEPTIFTHKSPIQILYPTLGLTGQDLIIECEGDFSGEYEANVGTLETFGDWSSSADTSVKAKKGKIKFLAETTSVSPGQMLGISISQVHRVNKGDVWQFFGITVVAQSDSVSHSSLVVRKCTIDQLDL